MIEREIEDIIYEGCRESPDEMRNRGFILPYNPQIYRQLSIGDYGTADLVAVGESGNKEKWCICVYELKRDTVTCTDLNQLTKYMGGMYDWIIDKNNIPDHIVESSIDIVGILVAPNSAVGLAGWLGPKIRILTVTYSPFKGLKFRNCSGFKYYSDHQINNMKFEIPDFIDELAKKSIQQNLSDDDESPEECTDEPPEYTI